MRLATFMMLAGLAGAALAQETSGPGATPGGSDGGQRGLMRKACAEDMAKYCADKTGPDRRACMTANRDKLSDGCKAAMDQMMQRWRERRGDTPAPQG